MTTSPFRRPTAEQIQSAGRNIRGKSYDMFILLLSVLRCPDCRRRTPCLRRVKSIKIHEARRLRGAFMVCWRMMTTTERRIVRSSFAKHLFLHHSEGNSQLASSWADECLNPTPGDILHWCKDNDQSTSAHALFTSVVEIGTNMPSMMFKGMWKQLSQQTQDTMLAAWYDILSCGCYSFKASPSRPSAFIVQLSKDSPPQVI